MASASTECTNCHTSEHYPINHLPIWPAFAATDDQLSGRFASLLCFPHLGNSFSFAKHFTIARHERKNVRITGLPFPFNFVRDDQHDVFVWWWLQACFLLRHYALSIILADDGCTDESELGDKLMKHYEK